MGIQYFYNFCITEIDDTDLSGDILSAVRKSYFCSFERIRDRITYDSEGESLLYDYCIERNKPLRWLVKGLDGSIIQEVLSSDNGRYYLCYYHGDKLFKRLLFSKLHTLLKAEYMDDKGAVYRTVEPRKFPGGLCLLYTDHRLSESYVLSAAPTVTEQPILDLLEKDFHDYTAVASTNEGIIWFLSDEQTAHFRRFVDQSQKEIAAAEEKSFLIDGAPLYEKINPKDFNIKRNLSAALDINDARMFGESAVEPTSEPVAESGEDNAESAADVLTVLRDISEIKAVSADAEDTPIDENDRLPLGEPDKKIMADGAVYSYYGELDTNENRSGFGRTLTDLGRTAYEGMYYNDKRSGKGSYFYKDGTLCYSGDWSENVRHGIGVGFSAHDGSIHVGHWENNKPEGNGVRLDADGEIKFVCKELSDGSTALMNYLENDTVLIAKYDKSGAKISEKIISLSDL